MTNILFSRRFSSKAMVLAGALLLSACSSLPESLKTDNTNLVTDYSQWQSNTAASNGEVRLGGVIAKVTNLENQTRVEVVNLPINSTGRPDIDMEPKGRFVGYISGFADPVTLSEGRLITLLGQSAGREENQVGDYSYDFPVMKVKGFHLWRIEETVVTNDFDSHFYPCRTLYCQDLRFGTRRAKVIQEVR